MEVQSVEVALQSFCLARQRRLAEKSSECLLLFLLDSYGFKIAFDSSMSPPVLLELKFASRGAG